MELSRSATYAKGSNGTKGNKLKRAIIAFFVFLTLTLGAGQVYATVTGTTLAELIANLLQRSGDSAATKTTTELNGLAQPYTDATNAMVDTKTKAAADAIAAWQVHEINRAKTELDAYMLQKSKELDDTINDKKTPIKLAITTQVNAGIDAVKRIIDAAMLNQIKGK